MIQHITQQQWISKAHPGITYSQTASWQTLNRDNFTCNVRKTWRGKTKILTLPPTTIAANNLYDTELGHQKETIHCWAKSCSNVPNDWTKTPMHAATYSYTNLCPHARYLLNRSSRKPSCHDTVRYSTYAQVLCHPKKVTTLCGHLFYWRDAKVHTTRLEESIYSSSSSSPSPPSAALALFLLTRPGRPPP